MRRILSIILIVLGVGLLLGAGGLLIFNEQEATQAEQASAQVMPQLMQIISQRQETTVPVTKPTELPPDTPERPTTAPEVTSPPEEIPEAPTISLEMPQVEVDGNAYVGYISIPRLELELPIMAQWDEKKLKIAPCRYSGSIHTSDLVLMGHNYRRHFRPIRQLTAGDSVLFIDADGIVTNYRVVSVEILPPTAVEEVVSGGYDLTMFTCTFGGEKRVTVYCDRVTT